MIKQNITTKKIKRNLKKNRNPSDSQELLEYTLNDDSNQVLLIWVKKNIMLTLYGHLRNYGNSDYIVASNDKYSSLIFSKFDIEKIGTSKNNPRIDLQIVLK